MIEIGRCPLCKQEKWMNDGRHCGPCELKFRAACARGEHDLCYADGGACCTCGQRRAQVDAPKSMFERGRCPVCEQEKWKLVNDTRPCLVCARRTPSPQAAAGEP